MFQVGQHVLCIKDITTPVSHGEVLPRKGNVYTVRSVHVTADTIRLAEIVNPPHRYISPTGNIVFDECFFRTVNFRPLSSDRLSIFRQHLAPVDKVLT